MINSDEASLNYPLYTQASFSNIILKLKSIKSYNEKTLNYVINFNKNHKDTWVLGKLKFGDLLGKNFLIGNLDKDYDLIAPTDNMVLQNLKDYSFDNSNIFVQDFAAKAFLDLLDDIEKEKRRNFSTESRFANIKLYKGYKNIEKIFEYNTFFLANNFKNYVLSDKNLNSSITNVKDFILQYTKYLSKISNIKTVTKSSLVLSYGINFTNGLKISIGDQDTNDIGDIYEDYLLDNNFHEFAAFCRVRGLLIDKYTPWILYPDFESANFLQYLNGSGFNNINDLFAKRYRKVFLDDLKYLKVFYFTSYSVFIKDNNIYKKNLKDFCSGFGLNPFSQREESTDIINFVNNLDDKYWLRLYCFFRHKEISSSMTQEEFDYITDSAYNYYKYNFEDKALEVINNAFKNEFIKLIQTSKTLISLSEESTGQENQNNLQQNDWMSLADATSTYTNNNIKPVIII